uniref:Coatomer subunit zeta n=1 Tax=Salmo trutta TaxID=8032 RepID=A0A673W4F0_SALTR
VNILFIRNPLCTLKAYNDKTHPTVKEQKAFEKNIFNKTLHRSEIALLEGLTIVYKMLFFPQYTDTFCCLLPQLMLMSVLNCLFALFVSCRKNLERWALLENMEGLFLAVGEIVDGGRQRTPLTPKQGSVFSSLQGDDVPLTKHTVSQVIALIYNNLIFAQTC